FFAVCRGNALSLFRAEEIDLLVRGTDEPLDIAWLLPVAMYDHWKLSIPGKEPMVNWFWEFWQRVFHCPKKDSEFHYRERALLR
ncbi:hypothetical protein V1523DRAFT_356342, partial [Lipomyces doorenjongii]